MHQRVWQFWLAGLLVSILASGLPAAAPPTEVALTPVWVADAFPGDEAVEAAVLSAINADRQKQGAPALALVPALRGAARQHSREMGERNYFSHDSPEAAWRLPWQRTYCAGYWGARVSENIAALTRQEWPAPDGLAGECLKLWLASPKHCANLRDPKWTHTGVGIVRQGDTLYATQLFAAPLVVLEEARLTALADGLAEVTVTGVLRGGVAQVWLDGRLRGRAVPAAGRLEAVWQVPMGSGAHALEVRQGTTLIWNATLETTRGQAPTVIGARTHRGGVKMTAETRRVPFTGWVLTARIRVPPAETALLVLNNQVVHEVAPAADGLVWLELFLPPRQALATIGIAIDGAVEALLFIDTTRPLAEGFRGRPQ
jgi:uncharacterized protein YkwD